MYSCRGVYIVGEDCIWFSSFVFCSRDWSSDFLWVCFGAEKAVWARVPGMLSPHAPRAWASLSLSTSPSLSRSTPASVQHCTLFLWGRSLSLSLSLYKASQWLGPHSAVTPPGLSSICSAPPIVTEYFVFVQSGEFPASCMCQGVCSWLPAGCLFTWHILCRRFATCI